MLLKLAMNGSAILILILLLKLSMPYMVTIAIAHFAIKHIRLLIAIHINPPLLRMFGKMLPGFPGSF